MAFLSAILVKVVPCGGCALFEASWPEPAAVAEISLGSAAIGSQWVQPFRHGDPIGTLDCLRFPRFLLRSCLVIISLMVEGKSW
eukprot:COSAG01_NODE_23_length_37704_cov_30.005877_35_plen_84_part_00